MISYKPLLCLALLFCMIDAVKAQGTDTVAAEINPLIENNRVQFGASLRPLRPIAGAPASFYTYFWEFGDGTYSFEKEPVHIYKDTGLYEVRLFATNNYDDGKKPNTRPRRIPVNNRSMLADNKMPVFFTGDGSLEIKTNQMPKPGEDMVLLIGYRNRKTNNASGMSGSIMLLYNEKQFSQEGFDIADVRHYHQEKKIGFDSMLAWMPYNKDMIDERQASVPGLFTAGGNTYTPPADRIQLLQQVKQVMNGYRKHNIWRVQHVQQNEEKFMFLSINTLPEMIKDTNAVVTITGLFVPDDPTMEMEQFNLELQIVASHDPNRIMLKNKKLNYRFTGKDKQNVYRIRFQNTGKGPAKRVAVSVALPGMLNASTIEVTGMKPACTWCDSAYANQSCIDTIKSNDSIQFIFNNIYLPGTQQDGVTDPDSTMGFIKYRIHFGKKIKKVSFVSRAAIVFDKNEPVYTNRSVGRFKKGLSPGIILGFGTIPGKVPTDLSQQNYSLGFTISEYAAYRKYFQWELFLQSHRSFENYVGRRQGGDTSFNGQNYKIEYRDFFRKTKVVSFEAVPVEFRYNLASFASAGVGALVSGEISRASTNIEQARINNPNGTGFFTLEGERGTKTESFATWRGGVFVDAQLGKVRVGPAVGVRFTQYVNPSYQRLLFYISWKI
jgi:PKD repeat protein